MKNQRIFNFKNAALALTTCLSLMMFSCDEENTVAPEQKGDDELAEITFIPKTLAVIKLENGTSATFSSEEDGIVYEVHGNAEVLDALSSATMLERFLSLTDESVAVPADLMLLEEEGAIKEVARQRGTTQQHIDVIYSKGINANAKVMASSWCSGSMNYYDTDAYGKFYRTFNNYPWAGQNVTVYSSWKNGGSKCKTVHLYMVNCSDTNTLLATTAYKNVWGNYKNQNDVKVSPSDSRFWSKTYISKRYRRVFVSGFGSGRFGGYVLFTDY